MKHIFLNLGLLRDWERCALGLGSILKTQISIKS